MSTIEQLLAQRVPPHNLEAERAILGACLIDGAEALAAAELDPEDFFLERHRDLFAVIATLVRDGHPVDLLTVRAALDRADQLDEIGGVSMLALLEQEAGIITRLPAYADLLREARAKRELIRLGAGLVAGGYDGQVARALTERTLADLQHVEARRARAARLALGGGLGDFLAADTQEPEAYIDGLLSSEGSGFIAGEEKLGKSLYALHEGLSLALGLPVVGRYQVAERRRVLFIEEEDPPRRLRARTCALVRGFDLDPDDAAVRAELNEWFRVSVWQGFSLDDRAQLARLDATLEAFRPHVVYLDVLRKLTMRDLNKAQEAGALLAALDERRRRFGVLFRVLHHYRKAQGFRVGRGSQELGGSFALGAWGEASLFFEPIGRKPHGPVRVDVQTKDGAPVASFRLVIRGEGPSAAPMLLTLTGETLAEDVSADDQLEQAVSTLDQTSAVVGKPGVSVATLAVALKKSDKSIRRGLKRLQDTGRVQIAGQASKGVVLYQVTDA